MRHLVIVGLLFASCAAQSTAPASADKPAAASADKAQIEKESAKEETKKADAPGSPTMAPKPALTDPQIANAGITLGKADIKGSLSSNEIASTFEKSKAGLEFCYDEARQNNPTLAGKAKLIFVIGADGSASNVDVKESGSRELDQCIEKKISQMKFPSSPDKTEVSYPLVFTVK